MKETSRVEQFAPEVLIYLQKVKNYFAVDEEAKNYFIIDDNFEFFFHHVQEISQKNFEDTGDPNLSQIQFELIRKTMMLLSIANKDYKDIKENGRFYDLGDFGKFSLN